jgi:hypothetical protein
MTIFVVSKDTLKKEVKSIKKSNSNCNHTKILEIIVKELGFENYVEYDKAITIEGLEHYKYTALSSLSLIALNNLEYKIKKALEPLFIFRIYFIKKLIDNKINEYKKCSESYGLCQELALYPYIHKIMSFREELLDDEYNLNESMLNSFIEHIVVRYKTKDLSKKSFIDFLKNKHFNQDDLIMMDRNELFELKKYVLSPTKNNNYEDFILPFLYLILHENSQLSIDDFKIKIKERIKLEKHFYEKSLSISDVPEKTFNIPSLYYEEKKSPSCNVKMLELINNNKTKDKHIVLGYKEKATLFGNNKEVITLSNDRMLENMYVRSGCGSGGSEFLTNLLFQYSLNGSGFINFDFIGDTSMYVRLLSHVKLSNSRDNVLYFNYKTIDLISIEMLRSFVYNKKKVHVFFPAIEKTSAEMCNEFALKVNRIIEMLNTIDNNREHPFLISMYDSSNLGDVFHETLNKNLFNLNLNNIALMLFDWNPNKFSKQKESLLGQMENKIFMKTYHKSGLYPFGIYNLKKELNAGEFIYSYNGVYNVNEIFKATYIDARMVDVVNLKIPNDFK